MTADTITQEPTPTKELSARFWRDGFAIYRGFESVPEYSRLRGLVQRELSELAEPIEYEAVLGYPGAPFARNAKGGNTPRRLLRAIDRDPEFDKWARSPRLGIVLRYLLNASDICVSQNHHNCIMTKYPAYSSETGWHRDIRYWSFSASNLITAWLALDNEHPDNGGLSLIPASHQLEIHAARYDSAQFLIADMEANRELIASATPVDLEPGDLLLFHCNTLHAAGSNRRKEIKRSLVFTYHATAIHPIEGSRSAQLPPLRVR